jgi:branched-subunit amino acid transport protein AzlD
MSGVWVNLAAAAAATYCWRFFGVVASRQMSADSPLILWIRAVATALIAALVLRFVYAPSGLLAATELSSRILALGAAVGGYFAAGKRIEAGVATAALVFVILESF